MSAGNGHHEQAAVVTLEVREAHAELLGSFARFMQAFGAASEVGIDAGAAIRASLKEIMPPEAWAEMPPMLRMMLS